MKRHGFTLIELLVVIAIIAILAAILFPVFARARAKALQNNCLSNVKQLVLGVMMYCSDNDQRFGIQYAGYGQHPGWYDGILPYVKNEQIMVCPEDKATSKDAVGQRPSYVASGNLFGASWVAGQAQNFVQAPASTIVLAPFPGDGNQPRLMAGGDWNYAITNLQGTIYTSLFRHNDGENWGFVDGHAKWMKAPLGAGIYLGSCAVGTSIPAGYSACFDYNCN